MNAVIDNQVFTSLSFTPNIEKPLDMAELSHRFTMMLAKALEIVYENLTHATSRINGDSIHTFSDINGWIMQEKTANNSIHVELWARRQGEGKKLLSTTIYPKLKS